jgi:lipoprotein-releasing system ATP-binding protein
MVKLHQISKSFGALQVLKDINMHVQAGESVSIVGNSGTGKTTLLEIMGTLNTPTSGQLAINGINTDGLTPTQLAHLRNLQIGFVFQFHCLLPEFTALENICIPAFIAKKNKAATEKYARELLRYFNLIERATHKPQQMSGGEQQRVAIARALVNHPALLLADEPSGNLDLHHKQELHSFLFNLQKDLNQTMIIVTHDATLAALCRRRMEMRNAAISEIF